MAAENAECRGPLNFPLVSEPLFDLRSREMTLSSFLSAFLPVVHGDAPAEVPITAEESQPVKEDEPAQAEEAETEKEDEKQDEQAEPAEEEEEEPEDVGRFLFSASST